MVPPFSCRLADLRLTHGEARTAPAPFLVRGIARAGRARPRRRPRSRAASRRGRAGSGGRRVGQVVDLGAEARPRQDPFDPARARGASISASSSSDASSSRTLPPASRPRSVSEVRTRYVRSSSTKNALLCVLPFVVGRLGPVAEQARVEVDRAVEIGHVEVDRADEAHGALGGLARGGPARLSRSFFLRCRSFCQRLIGRDPRPTRRDSSRGTRPGGASATLRFRRV